MLNIEELLPLFQDFAHSLNSLTKDTTVEVTETNGVFEFSFYKKSPKYFSGRGDLIGLVYVTDTTIEVKKTFFELGYDFSTPTQYYTNDFGLLTRLVFIFSKFLTLDPDTIIDAIFGKTFLSWKSFISFVFKLYGLETVQKLEYIYVNGVGKFYANEEGTKLSYVSTGGLSFSVDTREGAYLLSLLSILDLSFNIFANGQSLFDVISQAQGAADQEAELPESEDTPDLGAEPAEGFDLPSQFTEEGEEPAPTEEEELPEQEPEEEE